MNIKHCSKCAAEFTGRHCKPCRNAYVREWNKKNPDKAKATAAKHYQNNQEHVKARVKAWRSENLEKATQAHAAWKAANPEKVKAGNRAYYLANKEAFNLYARAWARANRAIGRRAVQNRRARLRNDGGVLSKGLSEKLLLLQKNKCACCKCLLSKTGYHLDHIIPVAKGGPHVDSNIQLLCPSCNYSKGARDPAEFMRTRGFLI